MTRQRIKFTIITGIVIMGIVFLLGIFYSENIPSGILLRAGITKTMWPYLRIVLVFVIIL
ncbi:hypothetical protein CPT76_28535 [Paenibacillus sp. AR247]|nr:hypothetical protein CPT76_28535 [Paenibacillus sp. AR247]